MCANILTMPICCNSEVPQKGQECTPAVRSHLNSHKLREGKKDYCIASNLTDISNYLDTILNHFSPLITPDCQ